MTLHILGEWPEREEVEAELCRRSFRRFVRRAWREVDPAPLVWGPHLDALCDHLQAVTEGKILKLVVNIPPGHAKSMIVSVLWPAWVWARMPWWRVLTASYEADLSMRDAVKSRTLMHTAWYQRHFTTDPRTGEPWAFAGDQNVKSYYANDALGFRLALSVGGAGTGYRGDALVIDDPLSAGEALSAVKRKRAITWKTETMSSRFNDMARAQEVLIMQRLHEEDLSGYLLDAGGWVHLRLPSRYEGAGKCPSKKCRTCHAGKGITPIGWKDWRKREGELLFPAKFPEHVLKAAESTQGMGPIAFAGQHQQRPVPASGGTVKKAWFNRRWHLPGIVPGAESDFPSLMRREYDPRTARPTARFLVTDAAFKDTRKSDKVATGVWDLVGPDLLLIDLRWGRMGFEKTLEHIVELRKTWTATPAKLSRVCIEDKANGPALIEVLRKSVPGVVPLEPLGSKEARVSAALPYFQAGNVWLPAGHAQLDEMIAEAGAFPLGANDDWLDMTTYAVLVGIVSSQLGRLAGLVKW